MEKEIYKTYERFLTDFDLFFPESHMKVMDLVEARLNLQCNHHKPRKAEYYSISMHYVGISYCSQ